MSEALPSVPSAPARWREVFGGGFGRLTLGLFLLEVLAAVQALVVAAIMPAVSRDLGGLRLYGWAFSAAALATVLTIPVAGQAVDRFGARRPLVILLGVLAGGTLVAGLAPSMPILVLGRFLQGAGAGAQYAVGMGTVAKAYPEALRARVLALLSAAWIVPGLVGPGYGALLASTVGWRWAFFSVLPLMAIAGAMVYPALGRIHLSERRGVTFSLWPPAVLALGSALALAGLTKLTVVSAVVIPLGVAMLVPAGRMLARAAASVARPGLSVALVAGFLLTMAFFATDGFVPLMLTRIRGRTVAEASIVVTLATVGWGLGSWWQSRVVGHRSAGWLIRLGAAGVVIGSAGVASGLAHLPLVLPYVAWAVAGLGMGVAYPTVYLVTMERAGPGTEGSAVALMLLVDTLGAAVGAGLGGASVALAEGAGTDLRAGLLGAFALAVAAGVSLVGLARRLTVAAAG